MLVSVASRVRTAVSGNASSVMCDPNQETDVAAVRTDELHPHRVTPGGLRPPGSPRSARAAFGGRLLFR